jgi:hypothetical protein
LEELGILEMVMKSVKDCFESGSEPVWLVDACGEEIVSINLDLGFADLRPTSAACSGFNHGTEVGLSNSTMDMDFDEVNVTNVQTCSDSQNVAWYPSTSDHSVYKNFDEIDSLILNYQAAFDTLTPQCTCSCANRRKYQKHWCHIQYYTN